MKSKKRKDNVKKKPTVAPGYNDEKFGEDAGKEDIRKGNYTKVVRVFLDENDPS
jgi:hypothetical protein